MMNIKTRWIVFLTFFALCCLSAEAVAQRRNTNSTKSKTVRNVKTSDDERRRVVEKLLLEGNYQHDGSGELMYIGTIESVPALLKVLEDNTPIIEEVEEEPPVVKKPGDIQPENPPLKVKPAPRKSYICTYVHAVTALQKITGQKFIEYQDWKKWWDDFQNKKAVTN